MAADKIPVNENLVDTLKNILTNSTIHRNTSNRYYVASKTNDVVVVFLTFGDKVEVYITATKPIVALKGCQLDLSEEVKKQLFQQLNARLLNKETKKITNNDFDKIIASVKHKYVNSDITRLKDISLSFERGLIETFNDIIGKEDYINKKDVAVLRVFLNQTYASWIKTHTQKTRQK